jgi:hypothetical protein
LKSVGNGEKLFRDKGERLQVVMAAVVVEGERLQVVTATVVLEKFEDRFPTIIR